jgi:hypothetical protein
VSVCVLRVCDPLKIIIQMICLWVGAGRVHHQVAAQAVKGVNGEVVAVVTDVRNLRFACLRLGPVDTQVAGLHVTLDMGAGHTLYLSGASTALVQHEYLGPLSVSCSGPYLRIGAMNALCETV